MLQSPTFLLQGLLLLWCRYTQMIADALVHLPEISRSRCIVSQESVLYCWHSVTLMSLVGPLSYYQLISVDSVLWGAKPSRSRAPGRPDRAQVLHRPRARVQGAKHLRACGSPRRVTWFVYRRTKRTKRTKECFRKMTWSREANLGDTVLEYHRGMGKIQSFAEVHLNAFWDDGMRSSQAARPLLEHPCRTFWLSRSLALCTLIFAAAELQRYKCRKCCLRDSVRPSRSLVDALWPILWYVRLQWSICKSTSRMCWLHALLRPACPVITHHTDSANFQLCGPWSYELLNLEGERIPHSKNCSVAVSKLGIPGASWGSKTMRRICYHCRVQTLSSLKASSTIFQCHSVAQLWPHFQTFFLIDFGPMCRSAPSLIMAYGIHWFDRCQGDEFSEGCMT